MPDPDNSFDAEFVARWYDRFGASYLAHSADRDAFVRTRLADLAAELPADAGVLDLACGAGVPATRWLADRFAVTGVDLSEGQIERAAIYVPEATLIQADMRCVSFAANSFTAVVCLYAFPHIALDEQRALLGRIAGWIAPGGLLLANWLAGDEDADDPFGGVLSDPRDAEALLREAGLPPVRTWRETGDEEWVWALACRPVA